MPNTSVVDEARDLINNRLAELDSERKRLEGALKELGGKVSKRSPGRPKAAKASGGKKRRKRRGGTRADQAVKIVQDNPGISASDIAKKLKVKPNYMYRVLGELENEGRVKKDGRNYQPGKEPEPEAAATK